MKTELEIERDATRAGGAPEVPAPGTDQQTSVALLTGGSDKPYVFGLATELISKGAVVELIGSDELDGREFHGRPRLHFMNLRGDQRPDAGFLSKMLRVSRYYARLAWYAATAKPKVFHILWNNRFQFFDRTLLLCYYKLLGKRVVLTVHNVNTRRRDGTDSAFNRWTLQIQYRLANHLFVHTEKMKRELMEHYGVPAERITVIPFGINNAVPHTDLTLSHARERLGLRGREKAILFFGRITPYKGLDFLAEAFKQILSRSDDYRLIVAGKPDWGCEGYWTKVQESLREEIHQGRVLVKANFIPDEETEVYFKAADVLVLPYRDIYQSGVLFLGHSFGLPVLASDVGSLKDEIVEGKTGLVFKPEDPEDLARTIEAYFASDLYANLNARRREIQDYATQQHSWDVVGQATMRVYAGLLADPAMAFQDVSNR